MHPPECHRIRMHGKEVRTPRWQQAYGRNYEYTGSINVALPVPPLLEPIHWWVRETIDGRFNGLLVNWYDGSLGHRMGPHRDTVGQLVEGSPIATISLGEARVFRMRPWKGRGIRDFAVADGSVLVIPWGTNRTWTHEVPASRRAMGRRISVTLRVFA